MSRAAVGHAGPTSSGILVVACAAQFMVVLDVSVVNVALPSIRDGLGVEATGVQWVVTAYALTFAGFLLLGGRLADMFGHRRVFVIGLVMFAGSSLAGGLAHSTTLLISARAVQGLGAAVLAPATLTLLTATFPDGPRRTRALALWTSVGIAGGTAGNVIGGVLTEYLSWRSTLLINVPIGAVAVALAIGWIAPDTPPAAQRNIDIMGAVSATAGLGMIAYGAARAGTDGWSAPSTSIALTSGATLLFAFVVVETRCAKVPIFPLPLLRNRGVAVGNAALLLAGACLNPMWFFLTLSMQIALGYSALATGLAFLPHTVVAIVIGVGLTPWLMKRVDGRVLIVTGSLLAATGFWWQSRLTVDSSYATGILLPAIVFSIGSGLLNTPITAAVTSGVRTADIGAASGLMNTTKQIGGVLGLSVLVSMAGVGELASYNRAFVVMAAMMVATAVIALALPAHRDGR